MVSAPSNPTARTPPHGTASILGRIAAIGLTALLLNTALLVAFPTASLWYFANVVLHPLLGLALAVTLGRAAQQKGWLKGRRLGLEGVSLASLAIGLVTGLVILVVGATGATRPLLAAHIATAGLGALLLGLHLWTRRSDARLSWAVRAGVTVSVLTLLVAPGLGSWHERAWQGTYQMSNPSMTPTTMDEEGGGPTSPFFPSSANTTTGDIIPAEFFLTSKMCGRCHKDIYEQWDDSMHHFSSFNNQWYRKSIEYMQDVVGTKPSKWCAGCHDHAVFFNGRFDKPIRDQIDTPAAQAGLGCTSCHAIVHVGSTMGQGDFVVEYPPLHDLATSENPLLAWAHDRLAYMAPEPHRRTFLKPFHRERTEEFCAACHKVHLDVPVNDYRWIRGFNEYDNWQASGVSGQGARSFYYPERPMTCNDCHMPRVPSDDPAAKDGQIRSHRFAAANTAVPFVNGDTEQLQAVQSFLRAGQISVDVFGIARVDEAPARPNTARGDDALTLSSTFAVGEESPQYGARVVTTAGPLADVVAPLDLTAVAVRRGESVRVEVVVRTRNVGHFFPGGTVDAFDVWVEFEAVDDTGRVLLHSGAVADEGRGPVEASAHFYRSLQLDGHGQPINKRNAWMARSVAYVRLIPPGAADTLHYRLSVPKDAGNRIELRAKVNYRKFEWWYTQWAYAGVRDPSDPNPSVAPGYDDGRWLFTGDTSTVSGPVKEIPNPPITIMTKAQATLHVVDQDAALPAPPPEESTGTADLRGRWNDYGIGLLLQGDLRGAGAAFRRVMAIDPDYPDGPINLARALLREGDAEGAIPLLEKALALEPDLARAHFFLGSALRTLGRYNEALTHLEEARAQYPLDRVVLGEVGRVHFLERRFDDAIAVLTEVLRIDPEDLNAHYNLMLAYRGNGETEEAARAQALYERFKADESAQAVAGPTLRVAPEVNNERQLVHEHR